MQYSIKATINVALTDVIMIPPVMPTLASCCHMYPVSYAVAIAGNRGTAHTLSIGLHSEIRSLHLSRE